jgi:hypothetical protein
VTDPTEKPGVHWEGNFYPSDPGELYMGEFEEIAQRSDITGYQDLAVRMRRLDPVAWKALFWSHDRRRTPDLKWSGYMGPPMRAIIDAAKAWPEADDVADGDEESGKAGSSPTGSAG